MKTANKISFLIFAVIAMFGLTFTSTASMAWGRPGYGYGRPGPGFRYAPRWNQGYWHRASYHGRFGWWWVVGGTWYFYAAAPVYPYPVAEPVYIVPGP